MGLPIVTNNLIKSTGIVNTMATLDMQTNPVIIPPYLPEFNELKPVNFFGEDITLFPDKD